jgi:hypothetical protein
MLAKGVAGGVLVVQRTFAASYCSGTLAGIRPRALTAMPCSLAHARTSPVRGRRADFRSVRRVGAVEPEPHRLIGRAAFQVVFHRDGYLLSHLLALLPAVEFAALSPVTQDAPSTVAWRQARPRQVFLSQDFRSSAPGSQRGAEKRRPGDGADGE